MTGERKALVNLVFADMANGTSSASGHLGEMGSIKSAGEPIISHKLTASSVL
jgi:hypothetical protein